MGRLILILCFGLVLVQAANAHPYPAQTGISAAVVTGTKAYSYICSAANL
jgi:hypothetical protein